MKKKQFILGLVMAVIGNIVQAQEWSITLNGGPQGLNYNVSNGKTILKTSGKVGVGYTYFLHPNWSLITGAELSLFRNTTRLNDEITRTYQVDSEGDAFEYRVQTKGYKEKSRFYGVSIPLMIQYHTNGTTQFYINAGGKVVFPFSQKSTININEIKTSGYYEDINVELINLPQHGFGTLNNWKAENSTKLKTGFTLSTEIGISFKLSNKTRLYTGVYVDYGLNDMVKPVSANSPLVNYEIERVTQLANGVLSSSNMIDQSKLLAYGIQIKFGIGKPKIQSLSPPQIEEASLEEEVSTSIVKSQKEPIIEKIPELKPLSNSDKKEIEKPIIFDHLGVTTISVNQEEQLSRIAELLKKYDWQSIQIIGHTCDIGTEDRNIQVGMKRAQAVSNYLIDKGIPIEKIETISKGKTSPLYPNVNNTNRQKNRRVEINLKE
ncbi:OmpA family protein [Empedobacter sp. UBA7248]|uniref:OmpA family protein n=1 Tax=Empedobacter sp. UBA7248 TaxID=1946448 RepID=UPI0025BB0CE8|nr:OmpA family protein [Empedobacter sp. UBA7248]